MTAALWRAAADEYCRRLASRHYENFSVASRLVSPRLRVDLARVYAYSRTTDDLGDERGDRALAALRRWRDDVTALFHGETPAHPVLRALAETVARYALPAAPFFDLIDANVQDQHVTRYETWPDLRAYCDKSAAPVGRIVLRLFGIDDPRAVPLSDDVCIGLQLANFAQDVRVDAGKGRTYLLQRDLDVAGVAGATRAMCERGRTLLAAGRELEGMVPGPLRLQLALYRLGGLAILEAIRRCGYRTDLARPRVSRWDRVRILERAVRDTLRGDRHARHLGTA